MGLTKYLRGLIFFMILNSFFECESFAMLLNRQEGQADNKENENKFKSNDGSCGEDRSSLEFWEGVAQMPIQFVDRNQEGTILIGQFSSRAVFHARTIAFRLLPKQSGHFFKTDGNWEREIGRKDFLKNIKKKYWLVAYMPNKENLICEAHQFEDHNSLFASFAQDIHNPLKNSSSMSFWQDMKIKPLFFHDLQGDNLYWVFLKLVEEPASEEDRKFTIELENDKIASKRLKFSDGTESELIEHGVFTIDPKCVFHAIEFKNPKLRVPRTNIALGKPRVRPKPVDRKYFETRLKTGSWLCYYDKGGRLLRAVESPRPSDQDEPKESKKESKK